MEVRDHKMDHHSLWLSGWYASHCQGLFLVEYYNTVIFLIQGYTISYSTSEILISILYSLQWLWMGRYQKGMKPIINVKFNLGQAIGHLNVSLCSFTIKQ